MMKKILNFVSAIVLVLFYAQTMCEANASSLQPTAKTTKTTQKFHEIPNGNFPGIVFIDMKPYSANCTVSGNVITVKNTDTGSNMTIKVVSRGEYDEEWGILYVQVKINGSSSSYNAIIQESFQWHIEFKYEGKDYDVEVCSEDPIF